MITIENDLLTVNIKTKGAELCSVIHKENKIEYIWNGDPKVWGKTSPLLFPIIGTLKDDTFIYHDKKYSLTRHGFARDLEFDIADQKKSMATFSLKSSKASHEKYPFDFTLLVKYEIVNDLLHVTYDVLNTSEEKMLFSIGGHPAFAIPLTKDSVYEDYYLEFNQIENTGRWPISNTGLIEYQSIGFFNNTNHIDLNKSLFKNDALVFKHLKSDCISLKSKVNDHGLDFHFNGFPYLGIWAAKDADFVCIEPWCGIADSVSHNQQLETKEGIEKLEAHSSWSRAWKVRFY